MHTCVKLTLSTPSENYLPFHWMGPERCIMDFLTLRHNFWLEWKSLVDTLLVLKVYALFTLAWIREPITSSAREILIFNHAHTFLLQEETPNVWPPTTTGWLIFYNTIFSSKYLWHLESRFMIIIVRAIKLDIIHLSRVSWLRCGPCRPTIRICSHQDCIKSMLDHTSATFILCITLFGTFAHQDCIKGIQNFLLYSVRSRCILV